MKILVPFGLVIGGLMKNDIVLYLQTLINVGA